MRLNVWIGPQNPALLSANNPDFREKTRLFETVQPVVSGNIQFLLWVIDTPG